MKQLKKTLLTLVALLAVTTGAWADEKMVTIKPSTMSSGAVTATGFGIIFNANLYVNSKTATITTSEGVITKLVIKKGDFYVDAFTEANVGVAPGTITYGSDEITVTDINAESVTLSRKGDKNWSTSSIDVYYADAPASSGPEVAWDKAKNTGSFTMPGGNVTLEPDYYPQAELATAPTAIPDVPATTDGAILSAGTVKKAIDNEMVTDLQGTVMYYAAQVSGDAAPTAPDYDAEGWTEEVPTAANFAQGKVYVWYYIKGADGNGDEYIFSDSEITALGTEGYVTIAAEPTYAVTFADDLAEPDKWTAEPAAGVKKGQTVTVSYTGTRKVLGVKAEKKAAAAATTPLDNTMTAWTAGSYAVPAGGLTYSDAITVSGDVTLTLTDGETLTLNKGISLASGATLTIQGNGTMNVNGTNESTASTVAGSTGTLILTSGTLTARGGNGGSIGQDFAFSNGSAGGVAINGNVVVNGGTLTATGGNGGNVGDMSAYCNGGAGVAAISGDLTINSGTVTSTNGANGQLGANTDDSSAGAGGKAVAGTVTDNR